MSRKRVIVGAVLVLSVLVVASLADVVGGRFLQDDESALSDIIVDARKRATTYRRVNVTDDPLEQNAAVSYQLAFKKLAELPQDAFPRVRDAVERDEPATAEAAFRQYCQEIKSPRVSDGLRSTYCDWKMDVSLDELPGAPFFPQSAILGCCLVLEGQMDQHVASRRAAADRYFQAAAYASDLGQGSWPMALAGISTSKRALRALADLISSILDDPSLLSVIKQELATLQTAMPGLNPGLSWDSSHVANALEQIRRSYIARRATPGGRLWPWQAIGAWRLSRSLRLAARLRSAAATADLDQIRQLGPQIDRDGAPGRGAVVYALPPRWDKVVQEVDVLHELLTAVQMAVPLQEWRLAHGSYPATLPSGQMSARYPLAYRPSSDKHAYQFVSRTGGIVLDVSDGALRNRTLKNQAPSPSK